MLSFLVKWIKLQFKTRIERDLQRREILSIIWAKEQENLKYNKNITKKSGPKYEQH